jgi:hypothetical protein
MQRRLCAWRSARETQQLAEVPDIFEGGFEVRATTDSFVSFFPRAVK